MNPTPDPWWVAPAVIAAVIAGVIAVITLMVNGRRARADRQRELFGAAFGDVSSYCEYPYIVRRRRHDLPEEERIRITTELSDVQRKLNHNRAVLRVEAPRVARRQTFMRMAASTALTLPRSSSRRTASGATRTGKRPARGRSIRSSVLDPPMPRAWRSRSCEQTTRSSMRCPPRLATSAWAPPSPPYSSRPCVSDGETPVAQMAWASMGCPWG